MQPDLTELCSLVRSLHLHRQRTDRLIGRLNERVSRLETLLLKLAEAEGIVAMQECLIDDLEMEPGVRVWTPVEVDE